jgi:hypothetical protein
LQRRKERASETDKLLQLANEVNSKTDQSSQENPSVAELRKVALIEKLAKGVRNRMMAMGNN